MEIKSLKLGKTYKVTLHNENVFIGKFKGDLPPRFLFKDGSIVEIEKLGAIISIEEIDDDYKGWKI